MLFRIRDRPKVGRNTPLTPRSAFTYVRAATGTEELTLNADMTQNDAYCEFDGKNLIDIDRAGKASPQASFIHQQFHGLVTSDYFPCVGAKSAFQRRAYRFGLFGQLGDASTTEPLLSSVKRFIADQPSIDAQYSTFVAVFDGPSIAQEAEFEQTLWRQLQEVHDLDSESHDWAPGRSNDPDDPHFAFSIGGKAFFLVGLNPAASRWARRFAWPVLIFNAHQQFEKLREDNRFERMQQVIKSRDATLQGQANPESLNFGVRSEARQYAGRQVPDDWRCPFTARDSARRTG